MDIDDGTYMPMTVFESEPRIGHTLLLLLVVDLPLYFQTPVIT
ncbi:hypothetical protein AB52_2979 [Escherichia coli 6-537-08_S1_C2]|nr:hypothetical protein ECP03018674_3250 [Escherichia coli P0301867.4]ENC87536.1 hypothetical protein ECP030186711_4961 [Escherichia coli P0301867.11]END16797.1 hypothetical protein ECP03018678_5376 [Escherichia coli P0301867.8]END90642.1 hypothetical protein ECP030186713_2973 [Escherichia coli P0301867.13]ENG96966.1 hypothetical protein ECP03018675_4986 [Escherichia coli P0301867.5]ENH04099.1 hypothetical protein ECP03018677_5037 [Escherichia coli P0301867.7]KEN47143.1 hypothetical protein A